MATTDRRFDPIQAIATLVVVGIVCLVVFVGWCRDSQGLRALVREVWNAR